MDDIGVDSCAAAYYCQRQSIIVKVHHIMKPVLLFVAAFSPLLGAPALAQTAAVPATAVASAAPIAPAVPADEKMICHVEEETGTRLGGHKECHTKQQWDAIARDERQDLARRSAQKIQNGGG